MGDTIKSRLDPLRDLVVDFAVKQVLVFIVAELPFMSFGPLKSITSILISKFLTFVLDNSILGVIFVYIDIKNAAQVSNVEDLRNQIKEAKKRGASKQEMEELDDELAKEAIKLIKFNAISK